MSNGIPETFSSTSLSLLERACEQDPDAWRRLSRIYGPLVYRWARQAGLQENDASDLAQEVFGVVATRINAFRHDRPGDSFRGWLYSITRNKVRDHFRDLARRPDAAGGTQAYDKLNELPQESTDQEISKATADLAHRALELMRVDFEPQSWQVAWRIIVEGDTPASIAYDLQMSVAAVYQAKSRVLRRLRQELNGLLDGQ